MVPGGSRKTAAQWTMRCRVAAPTVPTHDLEAKGSLNVVETPIEPERREDWVLGRGRAVISLELSRQDRAVPEGRVTIEQIDRPDIQLEMLPYLIAQIEIGDRR